MVDEYNYIIRVVNILTFIYLFVQLSVDTSILFSLFCYILPALSLFQRRSCMFYFIFKLVSVLPVLFYFPSLPLQVVLFCCL